MADLNQLAARLVRQATDDTEQQLESAQARAGRKGGRKGGEVVRIVVELRRRSGGLTVRR